MEIQVLGSRIITVNRILANANRDWTVESHENETKGHRQSRVSWQTVTSNERPAACWRQCFGDWYLITGGECIKARTGLGANNVTRGFSFYM